MKDRTTGKTIDEGDIADPIADNMCELLTEENVAALVNGIKNTVDDPKCIDWFELNCQVSSRTEDLLDELIARIQHDVLNHESKVADTVLEFVGYVVEEGAISVAERLDSELGREMDDVDWSEVTRLVRQRVPEAVTNLVTEVEETVKEHAEDEG